MTKRTIISGSLLALLACGGSKKEKPAEPPQSEKLVAALPDAENAWPLLAQATAADVDDGSAAYLTSRLLHGGEADPGELAAAEAALARHAGALLALERGTARGRCRLPEASAPHELGPGQLRLMALARLKVFRGVVAAIDGDLEDASRDIAGALAFAHLMSGCGGGMLFVTIAQAMEVHAIEAATWLARLPAIDRPAKGRMADALAARPAADPLADAFASEAKGIRRGLDELVRGDPQRLVEVVVVSDQLQDLTLDKLGGIGEVDQRVARQIGPLLARHRRVLDAAASHALIARGLGEVQKGRSIEKEKAELLAALQRDLGPAMALFTAPESFAGGVPAEVEQAFLRADNPLGRLLAARSLESMAAAVERYREKAAETEKARAILAAELAR